MWIRVRFPPRRVRSLALLVAVVCFVVFFFIGGHQQPDDVPAAPLEADAAAFAITNPARTPVVKRVIIPTDAPPPMPASSRCRNLAPTGPTRERFAFQRVSSDSDRNYVYSAFYDHRDITRPVVKVIGLSVDPPVLYCQYSYRHREEVLISEATAENIMGGHGRRYSSVIYTCAVPDLSQMPYAVSMTKSRCTRHPANHLVVVLPSSSPTVSNFAVCMTPLNYKFDRYLQLVEIIEVNRLFGADKFVFYNCSSGPKVSKYLRDMKKDGLVDVVPWPLPMPVDVWPPVDGHKPEVHYFAQLAALNDCLYRYMFSATHIVFTDLDEVIVPRPPHNTWQSLLTDLRSKLSRPPAMFMFRNVFFWLEWPDDLKYGAIDKVKRLNLTTLLKTRREQTILPFGQRSKCIVVPPLVNQMGVHEVNKFSGSSKKVFVDPSFGLLHHYRVDLGGGVNNAYLTDRRMADFADMIVERAWSRRLWNDRDRPGASQSVDQRY